MSNTISQNPMLAKLLLNPDGKAGEANKGGLSELVRADQAASNAQNNKVPQNYNDQFSASEKGRMTAARMEQVESAYQYSESMSLKLMTKEGDEVTVDFRQLYSEYQSYRQTQATEEGPSGVRYFESKESMEMTAFEEQFAFSVQGDLNEDELKAVFDVFEQVDELANNFFDGNIEKALEKAVDLKVDFGQLQSIQVNLTQTQSMATRFQQSALSEYENVKEQVEGKDGKEGEETPEEYGVSMADLPPYLQKWQAAIEKLDEHFENPNPFFNELMSDVASQRFPEQDSRIGWFERVEAFHERLAEYALQQREVQEAAAEEALESDEEVTTGGAPANAAATVVNEPGNE